MYVRHVTVGYIAGAVGALFPCLRGRVARSVCCSCSLPPPCCAEVRYPFCQPCSLDFNFYIHSPSRDADSGDMLRAFWGSAAPTPSLIREHGHCFFEARYLFC